MAYKGLAHPGLNEEGGDEHPDHVGSGDSDSSLSSVPSRRSRSWVSAAALPTLPRDCSDRVWNSIGGAEKSLDRKTFGLYTASGAYHLPVVP